MSEMKKLFIDKMNNDDLFNGDLSLSSEGKASREATSVASLVNKEIDGTIIKIDSKKKKETMTTFDVSLVYKGIFVKINYTEKLVNDKLSYKINNLESEINLSDDDKNKILTFVIYQ